MTSWHRSETPTCHEGDASSFRGRLVMENNQEWPGVIFLCVFRTSRLVRNEEDVHRYTTYHPTRSTAWINLTSLMGPVQRSYFTWRSIPSKARKRFWLGLVGVASFRVVFIFRQIYPEIDETAVVRIGADGDLAHEDLGTCRRRRRGCWRRAFITNWQWTRRRRRWWGSSKVVEEALEEDPRGLLLLQ